MGTISETFSAGETKQIPCAKMFRLLTTSAPVDLDFIVDQRSVEKTDQVEAGFVRRTRADFVTVKSATAQTVKMWTSDGDGDYDRVTGEVGIIVAGGCTAINDITLAAGMSTTVMGKAGRKELHVVADGAYKLGQFASTTAGVRVPGGVLSVYNTDGNITFYNPGAGAIKIELTEFV